MAKKVILKDHDNNEIMPITRGELILDSSGNEALHSNEFLATDTKPGLMSAEDKNNFDKSSVAAITSTTYWGDSLTVNIKGVEKTLTIPNEPTLADLTNNLTSLGNVNAGNSDRSIYFKNGVPTPISHLLETSIKFQSDVTTEDTWRKLGAYGGAFIQLNLTSPINISNWSINGYDPMLVFGVDYNKGFIELSHMRHTATVSFGGSNNGDYQTPWYWKLKGTDTAIYTLPTTSSTLVNTAEAANIALTTVQNYLNLNESTLDNLQNLIDLLENNKETIEGLQEIISGYQKIIYDYYPTANSEDTTIKGNILAYSPLTNFDSVGFTFYDTKFYHATSTSSNRTQVAYGYSKQSIAIRNYYNGSWNNWKQVAMADDIPTKLSDLTDDVVSGKYLPLSGGTIIGSGSGILKINRTSGNPLIAFQANGTSVGFLGIDTDASPCYVDPINYGKYILIHSGNIGSQSVNYASSAGNADLLDGYHASSFALKTDLGSAELANNITTISKTLTVTQNWMDTGIKHTDLPNNGTYIIQIYTHNSTDGLWYTYWSGIMSWFQQETNSTESDEIILHRAGHAYSHTIYLRTIMTARSDGRNLRLQIAADTNLSTASTYTFKFKRVI